MKLFILLVLLQTTMSAEPSKCACASVDTYIHTGDVTSGILKAPNCLPYVGNLTTSTDGRGYAHVTYHNKPARLLTSDVYIKGCKVPFGCACPLSNKSVYEEHNKSSSPLATLGAGQCQRLIGKPQLCKDEIWLAVESGWILGEQITFHEKCIPQSSNLRIVSRMEWGARTPKKEVGQMLKTPHYVIIHHGASPGCTTSEGCAKMTRIYQNVHMNENGWDDIGYNFLVGEDGNVYEGRGWDAIGAHSGGWNSKSMGVAVIGNFVNRTPNKAALDALRQLLEYGVAGGKLSPSYTLLGRSDLVNEKPTLSPGKFLLDEIKQWDHYNLTTINN